MPSVTDDAKRHNLPAQVIPFVGCEELLAQIGERLADPACRLLTLEAAARRLDDYAHGVFFVSLAPLDAVESIVPTTSCR